MKNRTKFALSSKVTPQTVGRHKQINSVGFSGQYKIECFRNGKLLWTEHVKNGVTNGGINNLLDVHFRNQTQLTAWFLGLIDDASYTAVSASDTMASHGGWIENQDYDEGTRESWPTVAATAQSITNTTPAEFTMSADTDLRGVFCVSNSTKGGTAGILWATALFASVRSLLDNDLLRITYTVNGTAVS